MSQIPLFTIDYSPEASTDAPVCPSCRLRPVEWWARRSRWYRYCGAASCGNHERKCMWCDKIYDRNALRAGTKYCGDECKLHAYARAGAKYKGSSKAGCLICHKASTSAGACRECEREYPWANSLRRNNAPQWVWDHMMTSGTCMNEGCGADISGKSKRPGRGVMVADIHVDHDHRCCDMGRPCGKCVRGVLCEHCNRALGMLLDDPSRIDGLRTYLERVR